MIKRHYFCEFIFMRGAEQRIHQFITITKSWLPKPNSAWESSVAHAKKFNQADAVQATKFHRIK